MLKVRFNLKLSFVSFLATRVIEHIYSCFVVGGGNGTRCMTSGEFRGGPRVTSQSNIQNLSKCVLSESRSPLIGK